jgi:NADH-quinone oxidoreductase subunit H
MMAGPLFSILIFPGFLFLAALAFAVEYIDRKLYARLQNRVGPPWFQPVADFIKLSGKEDIIPDDANPRIFKLMPVLAVVSAVSAFFYIPLWREKALFYFTGDVIVLLYLLTIPTVALFLGGWYSTSVYSKIGAVRALTQLFAYEAPLFMSILGPALLANTWSLSEMTIFYAGHPGYCVFNLLGFAIAIVALLGKLEKVPFDIAEAETEIVAGTLTEYSGRLLALFRLAIDIEMVVGAALLAAVFFPFGLKEWAPLGFGLFILKVLLIVAILSVSRTVFARLRIDQMVSFCWKYLAPFAFLQLIVDLVLKGVLSP